MSVGESIHWRLATGSLPATFCQLPGVLESSKLTLASAQTLTQAGIRVHDVVKSIALIVERLAKPGDDRTHGETQPDLQRDTRKTPVLLVLRGTQRADLARVASHLQVGRKQLRIATHSE